MNTLNAFDQVREQVKQYLPQYLAKFGIDSRDKKKFRCIVPSHQDSHPSCGVIPGGSGLFHCFSCGFTGDIFDAAIAKENKPLSGRGFITDNLMYLAKMFNVAMPEMDINDEEMFEIDARRAYAQASRIITQAKRSEIVVAKLAEYGWPEEILHKIGIGTVESYDSYIEKMTKDHGHSLEFLKDIHLDAKVIFRQSNLIYTIRDEHGSPIAFSARNLKFETENATYKKKVADIDAKQDPAFTKVCADLRSENWGLHSLRPGPGACVLRVGGRQHGRNWQHFAPDFCQNCQCAFRTTLELCIGLLSPVEEKAGNGS